MTETFDEPLATRFLLHDGLSESDRATIQDRAASDAGFFESLCALEDDLILRFHRGELTRRETELFEIAYASPSRQERVTSGRELLDAARAVQVAPRARTVLWQRAREWLTRRRVVPGYAFVTATLLLVAAVSAALFGLLTPRGPVPVQSRADAAVRLIAAFDLAAIGARRASAVAQGSTLRVPATATDVQLALSIAAPMRTPADVEVVLRRPEGGTILTAGRVQLNDPLRLTVTVPAGDFADGDYVLTVRRRAADGPDLAAHAFRVERLGTGQPTADRSK